MALVALVLNFTASAQRSKNDPTPIHSTKRYQQEEKNMDGVSKWIAWGNGDIYDDEAMLKRQDTSVEVMASKEFPRGVMPKGKDVIMFKADAFNLAQMNNFFGIYNADYHLSKVKPNLFLFRRGYYLATYDDVRESYYFDYHAFPLTAKDPILKKNGCKVFWIDWAAITKEVKPVDLEEIENQKHAIVLSKEESDRYLRAVDSIDALHVTNTYAFRGGYENHINVDKKEDYPGGKVLSRLEFWTRPEEGRNIGAPTEDITFSYDHKTRKGTILWLTTHGSVKYHSETETRQRIDKLISNVDKFI